MFNYYNPVELKKIIDIANSNPVLAKDSFIGYFERHPKDYSSYSYLISSFINLGEFEEADRLIDYVNEKVLEDKKFGRDERKLFYYKKNISFCKLRLLMYLEKYEEFYNYYLSNYDVIGSEIDDNNGLIILCKEKLGIINFDRNYFSSYLFKQMIEYRIEDFNEHIKKHQADYAVMMENSSSAIFTPDFPMNDIIKEIRKYIPSSNCLFPGFYDDLYVFKYDGCGRDNNRITDYFKVFTFHGTCNFITMTPSIGCDKLPYVDLNYLRCNDIKSKKRISQIDKFNKKYNLK